MMKFGDRLYVKGYTEITPAAVERLKELGVELRRSPRGYDSFFLPEGVDGGEFLHRSGSPEFAGTLRLKSEVSE